MITESLKNILSNKFVNLIIIVLQRNLVFVVPTEIVQYTNSDVKKVFYVTLFFIYTFGYKIHSNLAITNPGLDDLPSIKNFSNRANRTLCPQCIFKCL